MYPEIITGSPEIYTKFLLEFVQYFEKIQILFSYFPDTDFVTRFHYDSNGLIKRLE